MEANMRPADAAQCTQCERTGAPKLGTPSQQQREHAIEQAALGAQLEFVALFSNGVYATTFLLMWASSVVGAFVATLMRQLHR